MNTVNDSERKPWEDLDRDLDQHVSVVSAEEELAIDGALKLQMISIRLQKGLLNDLKMIAEYHKIGYQPLIRDLLNRFAKSEKHNILCEIVQKNSAELATLEREETTRETSFEPIDKFLERERKTG